MGLLFQPRRTDPHTPLAAWPTGAGPSADRGMVVRAALEAVVLGDASHFRDFFTDDVTMTSPHLAVVSRESVQTALGVPEDSLSDVEIDVHDLTIGDTVVAEWRLEATFTGPLLFDDNVLIEPTGRRVQLTGVSVAEFRDVRICVFRHYFDDSQLLDQVPGVAPQVRWTSR